MLNSSADYVRNVSVDVESNILTETSIEKIGYAKQPYLELCKILCMYDMQV